MNGRVYKISSNFFHVKNFVYRDLQDTNIIFDSKLFLIDFN